MSKTERQTREASARVSEEVERALHPTSVYLFYREGERSDLSLTYSSGGSSRDLRIPEDFQLLRLMELQGGAQDFPFPPKTNLPRHEKDWRARTGARLVVPMTNADRRLAGLFLLGEKKSEVPYTARDFSSAEEMRDALIPALDACPTLADTDAPALDADTVMLRDRPAPSL